MLCIVEVYCTPIDEPFLSRNVVEDNNITNAAIIFDDTFGERGFFCLTLAVANSIKYAEMLHDAVMR